MSRSTLVRRRALVAFLVVVGSLLVPAPVFGASIINVDTISDDPVATPADCSLREAIQTANTGANVGGCTGAGGGPYTINVPAGTYNIIFGDLAIGAANLDVTIQGAGSATTIIQAPQPTCSTVFSRIFNVDAGGSGNSKVAFNDLTISHGTGITGGGGIRISSPASSVTVTRSVLSGNCSAGGSSGGGIGVPTSTVGSLTLTDSTFSANVSTGSGGAVFVATGPMLVNIKDSVFDGNSATAGGGALSLSSLGAPAFVDGNTFTANVTMAGSGGAISIANSIAFVGTNAANVFVGNTAPIAPTTNGLVASGFAVVTAPHNWWGCNEGPIVAQCDTVDAPNGSLLFSGWVVLSNSASPSSIPLNQAATLTADVLHDSNGATLTAAQAGALVGRMVTWSSPVNGSLSNQQTTIQANGTATATFTPAAQGAASADATVDNATATANLTITAAVDTAAPVVSNVNTILREGGHIGSVSVTVSWQATDDLTPTDQLVFQIQRRRFRMLGPTAWKDVATVTGVTSLYQVPLWHRYQYRVRATDTAGHTGDWSEAFPITFIRRDERHFTRDASWTVTPVAGSMRGSVARSSTPGGAALLTFTGSGVAIVATTGPGQGRMVACIDPGTASQRCRTVDLSTLPAGMKQLPLVFTLPWGDHTLAVGVISGSVDLDGAIFSR